MGEIDIKFFSQSCQCSVGGIQQGISRHIVRRSDPFSFEYAPKGLCNIQMRRIWRQEEKKQPSFFPYGSEFPYEFTSMYSGIIQYKKSVFLHLEGKAVKKVCCFISSDTFCRIETLITVVAVYHAEYIQPERLLRRDKNIFSPELPAIGDISFRAYMTFISEVKVYKTIVCLSFEFLQLLGLIRIELRRGFPLGTFSYTSISRANADKKALNVLSEASLPVARCHASLAFFTLCLSFSMAVRTVSSSEQPIIGLRPRPGRVSKPWIPSDSKRFTQEFTDICVMSVCSPTDFEVKPEDFRRTARQRIRKAWLLPSRKPRSNCRRCEDVSSITLIFAIAVWIYMCTQNYTEILI